LESLKSEGKFPANLSLPEEEPRRRRGRPSLPHDPAYEQLEREHEEATKVKNIQKIILGRYGIDCWYFSPYPDEYSENIDLLFICEKCLKYMKSEATYQSHYHRCDYTGPPGKLIYLKEGLAIFELEGEVAKLYCQNLCLLAKLFLDHKTLYYDVSPFFFYVLCEVDESGVHPVGYFSKEKSSPDDYNLACIMILPPYQKRGYGRFLIQLSYEITRREGKTGSPEKPLSDLGRLSYSSFWAFELLTRLRIGSRTIPSIKEISFQTGFKEEDINETLTELGLMRQYRGQKVLNMAPKVLEGLLKPFENKKFTLLDPECLNWP
jgi:histone acetyltransferase MYST1